MALLKSAESALELRAHRRGMLDDPFLLKGLDGRDGRGACERMTAVGESAREILVADPVGDLFPEDHRGQRDVARVDALGDDEDVWHDVPVLAGEPLAGATEAGDDLVANE